MDAYEPLIERAIGRTVCGDEEYFSPWGNICFVDEAGNGFNIPWMDTKEEIPAKVMEIAARIRSEKELVIREFF